MTTTTERIAELTAAWEEGANYGELPEYHVRASDYALSEDDWRAYLSDDEAAEIVALIERQAENQERAERIAAATPLSELAESIGLNPADYS